jgi:hypothetical protein
MEDLARKYGPNPEVAEGHPGDLSSFVGTPTASFELARPSKEEARASLINQQAGEIPEDAVDIDPRQWLQHEDNLVVDYVLTRAGRLKIAALTESENDNVRKAAEKPRNPGKPQLGKEINLKLLRLWTIAFSLNKAYGYWGTPNELTADAIIKNNKLAGEITTIVTKITEISGYKEEGSESASSFLSFS